MFIELWNSWVLNKFDIYLEFKKWPLLWQHYLTRSNVSWYTLLCLFYSVYNQLQVILLGSEGETIAPSWVDENYFITAVFRKSHDTK
jgi:hypothetical protein